MKAREIEPTVLRGRDKEVAPWRLAAETRLMGTLGRTFERASWPACRRAGAWLGLAFFGAVGKRREMAIDNVRVAFPDISQAAARQIARRSMQNFAMTFCEFLHLPAASPADVRAYSDIDGLEHILRALENGRGALLLTAHLGNWEVMAARAAQDFELIVMTRPSANSGVQAHLERIRYSHGIRLLSKYDTARSSLQTLRDGRTLAIMPDQYDGGSDVILPFFGRRTRLVSSLARLSLMTGAPIIPSFGVRRAPWLQNGRTVAEVSAPLEMPRIDWRRDKAERESAVVEGTRLIAAELENIIRRYPEQWLWMHRRWRSEDEIENAQSDGNAA